MAKKTSSTVPKVTSSTIGCLGEVAFYTKGSNEIQTFSDLTRTLSAKYSGHDRHGQRTLTEFTGVDTEKLTFNITLSAFLGVSPKKAMKQLENYLTSGEAVSFVLGKKTIGKYRWNITGLTETYQHMDNKGNVFTVDLKVTLQEYLKS